MKYAHKCPKCGSEDVVLVRGGTSREAPKIPVDDWWNRCVEENRYVCCACGYVEHWVDPETFVEWGGKKYWLEKEEEYQAMLRRRAAREQEEQGTW